MHLDGTLSTRVAPVRPDLRPEDTLRRVALRCPSQTLGSGWTYRTAVPGSALARSVARQLLDTLQHFSAAHQRGPWILPALTHFKASPRSATNHRPGRCKHHPECYRWTAARQPSRRFALHQNARARAALRTDWTGWTLRACRSSRSGLTLNTLRPGSLPVWPSAPGAPAGPDRPDWTSHTLDYPAGLVAQRGFNRTTHARLVVNGRTRPAANVEYQSKVSQTTSA